LEKSLFEIATLKPTGEIVARMPCCRRTAIGFSGSSQKTSANISIKFWMLSCELWHTKKPEQRIGLILGLSSQPLFGRCWSGASDRGPLSRAAAVL